MGPLPRKGNMKQKITDYLDEIYGGTFTATHLQKLVTRLESAGNDSNLLILFYVQIMPDDFVMQLHRF
ncbi:sugar phosphorylase [Escherichia coli]|nr:sugar phosphorylase [Escherichia coli]